jgi:peptide/nickel transport system ATP-binding protein
MTAAEPLLVVQNLRVEYRSGDRRLPVVKDFSLSLQPGETYGLVGESGCGKSTVAYALLGYVAEGGARTGGSIRLAGADPATLDAEALRQLRGGTAAMVFQEPVSALNPVLTIGRQLVEAILAHRRGTDAGNARAETLEMMRAVRLPEPQVLFTRYPHQLSGGQAQRAVIAMALLARPKLLVLDEPTTGLDATVEAEVVELVADLARRFGTAIVYISHNLALVGRICDRIGVMYSGRLVEEASASNLFSHPRHPYTAGLLACRPSEASRKRHRLATIAGQVPAPDREPPGCSFGPRCSYFQPGRCDQPPEPPLEVLGEGRSVRCVRHEEIKPKPTLPPPAADRRPTGDPVLAAEHLTKRYPTRGRFGFGSIAAQTANDDVSLELRQGEILALVGESGSGKSTLAKIAIGLEEASGGRLVLFGTDVARTIARRRPRDLVRRAQMVFQNPDGTLNPAHTLGAILARAVRRLGRVHGRDAVAARVASLLEAVSLPAEFTSKLPGELSGGQRQRVGIARAFAGEPDIVIADEPVSALDVSIQASIVNLLQDMQAQSGTAFLFISHDLALVHHLADRVAVLYGGQLMEIGETRAVFAPPFHPYTARLLAASGHVGILGDAAFPRPSGAIQPACAYFNQCALRISGVCDVDRPPMRDEGGHAIACHRSREDLIAAASHPEDIQR